MPTNRDYNAPGVFAEDASTTIPPTPISGASYREEGSDQDIGNGWPFAQMVNSARFNQIMYKLTRLIKGVDEQGILSWSSATDYGVDAVVIGSDGQEYVSILTSGPSGAGAQDPVSAPTYWRTKAATQTETDAGTDDRFFVTPKKLRWGFSALLEPNGYIMLPTWMGGFVIQWFSIQHTAGKNVVQPFVLPVANQNETLTASVLDFSTATSRPVIWSLDSLSATQIGLHWTFGDLTSTTLNRAAKVIAIGY